MVRGEAARGRWRGWQVALLSVGLIFLLDQVIFGGPIVRLDHAVRGWAHREPLPVIGPVAQVVADLAYPPFVLFLMLVVVAVVSARRHSWRPLTGGVITAVILTVVVLAAKHLVGRTGPEGFGALAWPSGHTTTAVVVCGVVAGLVPGKRRHLAAVVAVLLPILVGVAMVLRNYHWASDVLAGWLLGPLVLVLAQAATKRLLELRGVRRAEARRSEQGRVAARPQR